MILKQLRCGILENLLLFINLKSFYFSLKKYQIHYVQKCWTFFADAFQIKNRVIHPELFPFKILFWLLYLFLGPITFLCPLSQGRRLQKMRKLDMKQTRATTNNNNNRDEKVTGILSIDFPRVLLQCVQTIAHERGWIGHSCILSTLASNPCHFSLESGKVRSKTS